MLCRAWKVSGFAVLFAGTVLVQSALPQGGIEFVNGRPVRNFDGAAVYDDYCSVCHGRTGKGDGRAAKHLVTPMPDLTRIAERNGRFDSAYVFDRIRNVEATAGNPMPCWARVLRGPSNDPVINQLIINNVTKHIESLQAPD